MTSEKASEKQWSPYPYGFEVDKRKPDYEWQKLKISLRRHGALAIITGKLE